MALLPCNPRFKEEYRRYIEPVIGTVPPSLHFDTYKSYAQALSKLKLPFTIAFLAGAGAIKTAVRGFASGPFTSGELEAAVHFVEEALEQGAAGLSFGIMYQPECYSSKSELVALARPVGRAGKVVCAHIRSEGDGLVESVKEVIDVCCEAQVAFNISHFKAAGIHNWRSKIFRAIDLIEAARAVGQPVTADFYPYDGGSTTIMSLIPPCLFEKREELSTRRGKEELRASLSSPQPGWDNMVKSVCWERIIISSTKLPEYEQYCGKSIACIALEAGLDPVDVLGDLAACGVGSIIVLSMAQDDIDTVATLPWTALISDSLYGDAAKPHPRLNGAFPKFLRYYVRERCILSMEQAIYKMTALPARIMGIAERGALIPNYYADVFIFNPEDFVDRADYANPTSLAGTPMCLKIPVLYHQGEAYDS